MRNRVRFPEYTEIFLSTHQLSASISATLTLDIRLFDLSVFPVQFAKLTNVHFFPLLPLLSSSVCKLHKVNKFTLCLYSLSLSLLEPSIKYETIALRLQRRKTKAIRVAKVLTCWLDKGSDFRSRSCLRMRHLTTQAWSVSFEARADISRSPDPEMVLIVDGTHWLSALSLRFEYSMSLTSQVWTYRSLCRMKYNANASKMFFIAILYH